MAYRKIHDSFWSDPEIEDWLPDQKYFYIYLITNDKQTATGVMQASIKRMALDMGWSKDSVETAIDKFKEMNRIMLDKDTKEIYVSKFYKYNKSTTRNHIKHLEKEIEKIKSDDIRDQVITDIMEEGTELNDVTPKKPRKPSIKKPNIPFENVWPRYGRGDEKEEARRKWLKMSDEERQEAWDGLDGFLKRNPDPKFRPYFHRYLTKKKWILDDFGELDEKKEPEQSNVSSEEVSELY